MSEYTKAIVAAISTIVMFVLFDEGEVEVVETSIATLVTTFLVYIFPNRRGVGRP